MAYATDTTVSVEKSRAELEAILQRYGATRFGYMSEETHAMVAFVAKGKAVRFTLPLPARSEERFWKTAHTIQARQKPRNEQEAYKAWEQACRSRWRALCLCVKAKLEAVDSGITTFEAEFLAHFVLPGGQTFGDIAIPQIEECQRSGKMPQLLLTNG